MASNADVLIIGGGLAGLCCARRCRKKESAFGYSKLPTALAAVYARMKQMDYLLDRGFQVLLTAYPEAKRALDYSRLELKASRRERFRGTPGK